MIRVNGPDGAIHQFPDETSEEVIKGAIRRHYGPPKSAAAPQSVDPWAEFTPTAKVADPWAEFMPAPADPYAAFSSPTQRGQQSDPYAEFSTKRTGAEQTAALAASDEGAAQSVARSLLGGIPFSDRALAAAKTYYPNFMGGNDRPYEENLAAERAANERLAAEHPVANFAGNVVGGLAVPFGMLGVAAKGVGAVGNLANASRMGATMGAAYGLSGSDDLTDIPQTLRDTAAGAGFGFGAGAAGHVLGRAASSGVGKIADAFAERPPIPRAGELKDAAQASYRSMSDSGAIYSPAGMARLSQGIRDTLSGQSYEPELAPAVPALLRVLERYSGKNATIDGLQSLRQVASDISASGPSKQRRLGAMLVGRIDDFIANPRAEEVLGGNAEQAAQLLREGNELWTRHKKVGALESAVDTAERRAARSGSGGNIDNATRTEVDRLLNSRNWTPDETAAIKSVVNGGAVQNAMRLAGKASPEGNGLALLLHLGAAGATAGHSLPLAAAGLRGRSQAVSELLQERNQPLNELASLRTGSQIAQPVGSFGFTQTPQVSLQPVDYMGASNRAYQDAQAEKSAAMGGMFGLGGAVLGGLGGDILSGAVRNELGRYFRR